MWHCSQHTLTTLRTQGVDTIQVGDKKGDVDTQMKDSMNTYLLDFAPHHSPEQKSKTLVVIMSGDRDFSANLKAFKDNGYK